MNSFVEKFREEVREYCERLESGLLLLEHDPENQQVIGEIFRIMHSMKGSGGMFGFDLLSDVTHDLESLYEIFKSKKQKIDSEVISFTLNSIDGLQNLMIQDPDEEHHLLAKKIKSDAQLQIARLTGAEISIEHEKFPATSISPSNSNQNTWYISFIPNENIFSNGTNPIYLIDELNALGECNIQVSFDNLPKLSEINPSLCYVSWNLFVATSENIDTLHDVFIFVSDNAQIQIVKVSSGNAVHNEQILADFLNAQQNKEKWEPVELEIFEAINTLEDNHQTDKEELQVLLNSLEEIPKNAAFVPTTVDSIRVDAVKIDQYMNLVSELITSQSRLEMISSTFKIPELELVTETFQKLSRQLRDNAFDMSLIPIQSVATRFKRLVHDLSKSLGKEVVLITEGMETELDKNIIEKLIEPLLHIIRNSLDHGIESIKVRQAKGKELVGTILLKASTVGSYVRIDIEDDGAGLDVLNIRKKAKEKGLINEQTALTNEEVYSLILEPGFSTSELVTDLSGRGIGMDVVRKRVQEMRGSIDIFTEKDRYTRFSIQLPLSLSIIDGLLMSVKDCYYVIPSSVIKKIYTINCSMLKKDFRQVVELEGVQFPYLNMHEEFFGLDSVPDEQFIVVVGFDNQLFGLVVDEVIREYQAVIKPLGRLPKGHDIFSGASILGTGQLALVIDTNKIIKKYSR